MTAMTATSTRRLALFGGSFNPPHIAQLATSAIHWQRVSPTIKA